MTHICGYYNGNRWPIQLVISKLNITLTLEPGKYVLDRQGRKINDPYFEVFANNKQLHRETSTNPVPYIVIPEVTSASTPTAPGNPVRAVTSWTRDAKGLRQPVLEQPAPVQQPAVAALPAAVLASAVDSVTPMSMDEARKRGLVRKTRDVPEDYGVNDTTGLPPSGIPRMKYSIDPGVNRPAPPLPPQMLTVAKDDPNRQTKSQLVAGLAQGAQAPAPDADNPFANTVVRNAPVNSPIVVGTPQSVVESAEGGEPPVEVVDVEEVNHAEANQGAAIVAGDPAQQTADQVLPEPELEPEQAPPPARPATARPATVARTAPPTAPAAPLKPLTPNNQFVCMACGLPHKFRSQLAKHAAAKHPDRINAIMAPYPEIRTLP